MATKKKRNLRRRRAYKRKFTAKQILLGTLRTNFRKWDIQLLKEGRFIAERRLMMWIIYFNAGIITPWSEVVLDVRQWEIIHMLETEDDRRHV